MTYASQVASDASLLAHYRLGEASGTTMNDASGNARHGTYAGTFTLGAAGLLTGDTDTALSLAGGGVGDTPQSTIWNVSAVTLVCWFKTTNNGAILLIDRHRASTNKGWQFRLDTGRLDFFLVSGGGVFGTRLTTTTTYNDNVRHMAVVTHDPALGSNHTKLFVDGVLVLQANNANAIPTITGATGNDLHIGANRAGGADGIQAGFVGTIDEASINSAALSATRIASLYNAGIGSTDPIAIGEASSDATATGNVSTPHIARGDASSDARATAVITYTGVANNRVGGRDRAGLAQGTWDPPVVPTPPAYALGARVVAAQAFDVPTITPGEPPAYAPTIVEAPEYRDRIVVAGRDVTYFRGIPTPFPGYQLTEPLMYGPTTLTFPQIAASFETLGIGDLSWLRPGKPVLIQRVDVATEEVVATDYRGVIIGFHITGAALSVDVGGEAQGRAALVNRQVPIWTAFQDIGRYAYSAFKDLGLRLTPYLGPTTGVRLERFGGQSVLDYISEILARSWNRQGNQWTIMPVSPGVYAMSRKDTTTIAATAYADDARVVATLNRDLAEEPNRIFMTGVTPAGQRIRFGVYPGLRQTTPAPYPMADDSPFGIGTTDADTDTGDGITVMIGRLIVTKYLDQEDTPGGYDAQVSRAIMKLQQDASDGGPTFVTGIMDPATWDALYDLSVTGYSLRWSHIEPAAERPKVRRWRRSATGAIMGRNHAYDTTVLPVDVNIDVGSGFTRDQMTQWALAELDTDDNWVGSVTFPTGALIAGDHTPGDPVTTADIYRARDLRPGQNLSLPLFQGGLDVHIAAVNVGSDRTVSVDVDTRARDAMKVWEIIARNRESRNNPARAWLRDHRSSTMTKDSMGIWDEVGGLLGDDIPVPGNTWTVFPVVAGQEGTVRSIRIRTNPFAEYVVAVFGDRIYPTRLARLVGNPLTKKGSRRWANETIQDALDQQNILLYIAGDNDNPCGYFPKQKTSEGDETSDVPDPTFNETSPLTGRWEDDAGFSYHTGEQPVLWVAVYTNTDTVIPRGRIMWNQLEAAV